MEPITTGLLAISIYKALEAVLGKASEVLVDAATEPIREELKSRFTKFTNKKKATERETAINSAVQAASKLVIARSSNPTQTQKIINALNDTQNTELVNAFAEETARFLLVPEQPNVNLLANLIEKPIRWDAFWGNNESPTIEEISQELSNFLNIFRECLSSAPAYNYLIQKDIRQLLVQLSQQIEYNPISQSKLEQMRAEYFASLLRRFEYLDLGGIAPRVQSRIVKLRMSDVFVQIQVCYDLDLNSDLLGWFPEFDESQSELEKPNHLTAASELPNGGPTVEIPDLLKNSRVVVLGNPGSGKSTLLRYIAHTLALNHSDQFEHTVNHLPILVRAVKYWQAKVKSQTLTLDTYIRDKCEPKWAPLFHIALDSGQALVMIDGLDEVVEAFQRKEIAEAIHQLVSDYPDNKYIITSRIVGYQSAQLSADFKTYTIMPLSLERITEFIEKWYHAIEHEAGELTGISEGKKRALELSQVIENKAGIRKLAGNPLLLTIIALVNWRGRKLPNRRVELYAHAAETLIESWPYRRQGIELETERVIRFLSPVAYSVFATYSSGDITENAVVPLLAQTIARIDGISEAGATDYAVEFLSQISEQSGIFRERGYDERGRRVFGFLHLTFAEYFAARYLAGLWEGLIEKNLERQDLLKKYIHLPRWREVVLLMIGDIGRRDNDRMERATLILRDLLTLNSDYEKFLHRDLLLAGECLADDLKVQPQAARYVLSQMLQFVSEPMRYHIQGIFQAMLETTYGPLMIDGIVSRLENEDKWTRWNAAWVLGNLGDNRASNLLIEQLESDNWLVRRRAADILGSLGDPRAIDPLLERLNDNTRAVKINAAKALGEINEEYILGIQLKQLQSSKSAERRKSAWILGCIGSKAAVTPLLALLKDKNTSVRLNAVSALGRIGDKKAVQPLLELLDDKNKQIRGNVASALGRLGDTRAVMPLIEMLDDNDRNVRWSAASALGRIGDRRAIRPLLDHLDDDSSNVRWCSAIALGNMPDPHSVNPLIHLLTDEDSSVRWHAAFALGQIGDPRAIEGLIEALEDEDHWVRGYSAGALGKIGDLKALDPLLGLLNDKEKFVREYAAEALGLLNDTRALNELLPLLDEDEYDVRAKAYKSVITILNRYASPPKLGIYTSEPTTIPGPWDNVNEFSVNDN